MMSIKKTCLILVTFLLVLTGFHLLWNAAHNPGDQPHVTNGVLDLRNWPLKDRPTITLDGEWDFFPNQLLRPQNGQIQIPDNPELIEVPGNWASSFDGDSAYGYGTYHLKILTSEELKEPYEILINSIKASSEVYANGEQIAKFGHPAETPEQYTPKDITYSAVLEPLDHQIDLLILASNFDSPAEGGIIHSIKLGTQSKADSERLYSVGFELVILVVMILHTLYMAIIYIFNRKQTLLLFFILLMLFSTLGISLDDDKLLLIWLPINYFWFQKLRIISYTGTSLMLVFITAFWFVELKWRKFFLLYIIPAGIFMLFTLLSPFNPTNLDRLLFTIFISGTILGLPVPLFRYVIRTDSSAIFLLLAACSLTSSSIWGVLKGHNMAPLAFYPFDILFAFLGLGTYWFVRYFKSVRKTEELAHQLQEADKTKDQFLANTSHELRTPLHGMINIAESVLNSKQSMLTGEDRKELTLLTQVGRRMALLVNDLLDLVQLREQRIKLHPAAVSMQSLASGVMDMLHYLTAGKSVELRMEISDDFPKVFGDEKRLTQVLFNLVHNAIKFTQEGIIRIYATQDEEGTTAFIHVADTGPGIGESEQFRIFDAYAQGEQELSEIHGGIGLGLSISQMLVKLHGGALRLQSSPGIGSTFSFSLPISVERDTSSNARDYEMAGEQTRPFQSSLFLLPGTPKQEATLGTSEETAAASEFYQNGNSAETFSAKYRILAVDDDPVNLRILEKILSPDHYHITSVLSGSEALTKLNETKWDLVIADVMMPHMSGYELVRIIRQRFSLSELPVLLLTARNRPEDIYSGFTAGANDYVSKPVDALELKYRVKALSDLKRSIEEHLHMEAAYLQAQIEPHFLFNTLNSITALSSIDTDRMNRLIDAFSSYLRISFDFWNVEELVPLEYELELVRSYAYIQSERFEGRLNVSFSIDPAVDPLLKLPPLSLQPLVENALRHGVLARSSGGSVDIVITEHAEYTLFVVSDDGVGMEEFEVKELLASSPNSPGRGIGLRNTNRRLQKLFGHGLSISSAKGQGTRVSFSVPKRKEKDD
ncbi:hypothetical protein AWM70_21265 [Paenibacillus yonginensis]|uniref:Circadian input-output histidine kinase CikA n=1 Tax=Paenibacillus yonginensis TaxID=1462996 RepID=A0A1B1N5V2_9BACL|nr:ATP-binding protein [Paenibacillus yonginensis]ANS76799.1 hypothetical protein AWM70_21265 [Paenibacillus yonginensis]